MGYLYYERVNLHDLHEICIYNIIIKNYDKIFVKNQNNTDLIKIVVICHKIEEFHYFFWMMEKCDVGEIFGFLLCFVVDTRPCFEICQSQSKIDVLQ